MDWACWRAGRRWTLGWVRRQGRWARQQALGRAGTARACSDGRRARAGSGTARALQATGARACGAGGGRRAGRMAGGAQARGVRGARGRMGAGAGRAAGAMPGRLGWPWAVHSVHSAHFRSVLTRFFSLSHQMNTVHCEKKKF